MGDSAPGDDRIRAWWDTRLFWLWIVANAVAYLIIVLGGAAIADLTSGVTDGALSTRRTITILVIALGAAALYGLAQARALQGHTTRWKWWFVANVTSWLFGALTTEVAKWVLGQIATYPGDSVSVTVSPAFPLLAIAFHGVWMLWVTAPHATSELRPKLS